MTQDSITAIIGNKTVVFESEIRINVHNKIPCWSSREFCCSMCNYFGEGIPFDIKDATFVDVKHHYLYLGPFVQACHSFL